MTDFKIGDRVRVPSSLNGTWAGEGVVQSIYGSRSTLMMQTGYMAGETGAFSSKYLLAVASDPTFIGIEDYEFEQRVTDAQTGGQKGRKLSRFALIPWQALRALARHYGIGALKYEDDNWRKGYDWDLSIDALERHLNAWKGGESIYLEEFTGRDGNEYRVETHHLIAVAWQAFTLYIFERLGLGRDTRHKEVSGG